MQRAEIISWHIDKKRVSPNITTTPWSILTTGTSASGYTSTYATFANPTGSIPVTTSATYRITY